MATRHLAEITIEDGFIAYCGWLMLAPIGEDDDWYAEGNTCRVCLKIMRKLVTS